MKLDLGTPEKFSFTYTFIWNTWFLPWFKFWYKDITIVGKQNIDRKTPTILAINHQNTAMDPLILCGTVFRQISWLARADLYNKKFLIPILHWFKILPIFRKRDGVKNLGENDIIFEKVVEIISNKKLVGIFPEGTHWGFRRLRPTRKAIPRIVCLAEEKNNYDMDINVNPVGIYYDDYQDIRTNIFIKIGEPIPMRQFFNSLQENPQVAENEIKDAIEKGMRETMIDIPQTDETYYTAEGLRIICRKKTSEKFSFSGNKQEREFLADKKTVEIIEKETEKNPSFLSDIKRIVDEYEKALIRTDFSNTLVEQKGSDAFNVIWNCMKLIALFPLFIIGTAVHIINYAAMVKLGKTLTKDPQFKNSIMFVCGALIKTIIHGLYIALWLIFVPLPWWTVFFMIASLYFLWTIFIDYPRLLKRTIQAFRFNFGYASKNADIQKLIEQHDAIENAYTKCID